MQKKLCFILLAALVAAGALGFYFFRDDLPGELKEPGPMPVISVSSTDFMLGDKPFHFVGAFAFPTLTHYVYEPWRDDWQKEIDQYLDSLKLLDVRVLRFLAAGPYQMEISNSEQPNWQRMDYLIEQCEEKGVYLVFTLWDYWDYSQEGPGQSYQFWQDERIRPIITEIVSRYKNSPSIFAWELINEGDLETISQHYPELYAWTKEMAEYIKALDGKHLLATGFSGEFLREYFFEAPGLYNQLKQKWLDLNGLAQIDFVTFHSYGGPIDLMTAQSDFGPEWEHQMQWYVDEALSIRQEIGKPILFEEWAGIAREVSPETRQRVYRFMLGIFSVNMIDNIFNGWGDGQAEINQGDAEEIEIIRQANEQYQ